MTPTQRRMLSLLADGRPHTRRELHALLWDEQGALSNIQPHLSRLRHTLRPKGQEIICEIVNRRICYRQVRLLRTKQVLT
jgi:hypothetical protein